MHNSDNAHEKEKKKEIISSSATLISNQQSGGKGSLHILLVGFNNPLFWRCAPEWMSCDDGGSKTPTRGSSAEVRNIAC